MMCYFVGILEDDVYPTSSQWKCDMTDIMIYLCIKQHKTISTGITIPTGITISWWWRYLCQHGNKGEYLGIAFLLYQ